ncbi:putative zinc finger protein 840 [Mytilus californianus]|uniref:putative zinc finger protein 840 n=1 Tax=Mytilus californianus TaxID=6549 RepID=UPI0022469C49|nr:putative zinc finger protein 840 [Mytilus californianus]
MAVQEYEKIKEVSSLVIVIDTYMCGTCNKEFLSRSGRSRHVRFVHTEHDLGCGECTKTFKSKDSLRRHERTVHQKASQKTHQGAGRFACDTCKKVYRRKEDLQIHLSRNHQAGPPSPTPIDTASALSPTPVDTTPALSPTPGAVHLIDFDDMMVIDTNLDLIEMEPIRF